ncbi:MAG TPA: tripartite tricarboxylate transporter substrate binding protein [Ramlibacter sp.]|nr:tripartite tricarboxylate transporter substrate binding protein [Ramlibacter sp.]
MRKLTSFLARVLCAWAVFIVAASAAWPEKPLTIVVPFTAGGITDVMARLVAEGMSTRLKQTVIVENKPGGNTFIGLETVSRAPADGYTLFLHQTATAAAPVITKDVKIDPAKVLAPVGLVATSEVVLVGSGKMPARTWQEFVAYSKANPKTASYGYAGGYLQLLGDYLMKRDNLDAVPVLYRGSADVQQALLGGTLSVGITTLSNVEQFLKDGRLNVLAVSGKNRAPSLPNVPTINEIGFPEIQAENITFYGLAAPAGTPKAVIDQLNAVISEVVKEPAYQRRIAQFDAAAASSTPEQMGEIASNTVRKWGDIARKIGYKPQ